MKQNVSSNSLRTNLERSHSLRPCISAKTLLLVTSDGTLRRQFRAFLSRAGVAASPFTTVRNGEACLAALAQVRPRLVVLDDNITDIDRLDLLRVLRQRQPEALVVYLANSHTPELERAVRQLGVLYYTEKPLDPLIFASVLSAAFASITRTNGKAVRGTFN